MGKQRASKLDEYAERLDEWFLAGKTLAQAQEQLRLDGVSVSLSRLSDWWSARQTARQQEKLLAQIATGARQCQEVEKQLAISGGAPELETLIKLHRVLILKLSAEGNANPELLELVGQMMKPVIEFSKLEQKKRELELNEKRFQRETCELFVKWTADERAKAIASGTGTNSEKIERLGQLMFGEDWKRT